MRILPLMRNLESHGVKCKLENPINWRHYVGSAKPEMFSIILTHPLQSYAKVLKDSPDIVIISKTSTPQLHLVQKLIKKKKISVIFDISDALFVHNSSFLGVPVRSASYSLESILQESDYVTVNGHYLLNYVKEYNPKSEIIHDPIDCEMFHPTLKDPKNYVTIGWEGNPLGQYKHLSMIANLLERLENKRKIRFKMVSYLGDPKARESFKKLESKMEIDYGYDHWLPLSRFAQEISKFDILLAPLEKTAWFEGKSALRIGIGMANGIPVIASPVGEQKYIIKNGVNGFLAKDEDDWYKYLKQLIEDKNLRESMGNRGRKTAENELSLASCGEKLLKILNFCSTSK